MKRNGSISRRLFLGGAGALVGLPLLESLAPRGGRARAAGPDTPRRLVFFITCFGCPERSSFGGGVDGAWRPSTMGADYALTPCLEPLAAIKGDVSVLSGLHNKVAYEPPGYMLYDHESLTQALLTGVSPINANFAPRASISVDQLAANHLKAFTPGMPSFEIGTSAEGYFFDNYCWRDAETSVGRTLDPLAAFNRLFAGADPAATEAQIQKRKHYRTKILDHAKADLARLQPRLGTADRQRLDQYLTSVNNLEARVAAGSAQCAGAAAPGPYQGQQDHMTKMIDLIPLAFQCDRTRVVSITCETNGQTTFPFLDAPTNRFIHHDDLSHPGADPDRLKGYVDVTRWKVSMFAQLVQKLKDTPEPDGSGSLLDNTTVVYLSEMGYGDGHDPSNLPVLVAGRGGGMFTPGKHLAYPDQPITSLYLNLLASVGVAATSFGNSAGALAGL